MIKDQHYKAQMLSLSAVAAFLAFILSVILCVSLESCGSAKNTLQSQTTRQENAAQQRKDTASVSTEVHETESEETNTVAESHIIIYDTKLPVDSITGRAPVLSDTYTKTTTGKKKERQKDSNTQKQASTAIQVTAEKKTDSKSVTQSERKETTIPKQLGFLAIALAILAGTVCVVWFVYKKRNK